ncbi:Gmad2 immunoglobulin-like domain-containing protein [Patescibacteria group bacterium]|nr:Gmad2 immunoglobulin-like domain-containing protein [Patescibacteria group bacterium]MBU1754774.1 Gmad2 immunoglobulin-like domain-containing protein [Patescibacteria group bacterium]
MNIFNIIFAGIVVVGFGILAWLSLGGASTDISAVPADTSPIEILSFADCEAAGLPVMESYPRQCRTPDGRTYTEELPTSEPTYVNASDEQIVVDTPTSGSVIGHSITVTGKARGPWYFEASFPVLLTDIMGNTIATGVAQAEGNWMTEEYVPFKATISIPNSYSGEAILVLKKDNPSGLPEKDGSVSFPVVVEY